MKNIIYFDIAYQFDTSTSTSSLQRDVHNSLLGDLDHQKLCDFRQQKKNPNLQSWKLNFKEELVLVCIKAKQKLRGPLFLWRVFYLALFCFPFWLFELCILLSLYIHFLIYIYTHKNTSRGLPCWPFFRKTSTSSGSSKCMQLSTEWWS